MSLDEQKLAELGDLLETLKSVKQLRESRDYLRKELEERGKENTKLFDKLCNAQEEIERLKKRVAALDTPGKLLTSCELPLGTRLVDSLDGEILVVVGEEIQVDEEHDRFTSRGGNAMLLWAQSMRLCKMPDIRPSRLRIFGPA